MVNVSAKYVATRWIQHRHGELLRFVTSWATNLFSFSEYVNEIIVKFLVFSLTWFDSTRIPAVGWGVSRIKLGPHE